MLGRDMDLPPQVPHFLGGSGVRCHRSCLKARWLAPSGLSFYAEATNVLVVPVQVLQVPSILVDEPLVR